MDLLGGAQLHTGQSQQAIGLAGLAEGRAVAAGVVVGEGGHVEPRQLAQTGDGGGGHGAVPAGGQAGVEMQVEGRFHGRYPLSLPL